MAGQSDDGPVLYLESEADTSGGLCPGVMGSGEYRVVMLTATQSLDALEGQWQLDLEDVRSPSDTVGCNDLPVDRITDAVDPEQTYNRPYEAAVIIATPQGNGATTVANPDGSTPLHGVRVEPSDLTGISMAFSRLVENWGEDTSGLNICLQDIESLLTYHDADVVYRFLNTVLATLQGADADVHAHVHPATIEEQTLELLKSLFDHTVSDDTPKQVEDEQERAPGDTTSEPDRETGVDLIPEETVTGMTDDEIETFLDTHGNGTLVFSGDGPYGVPMSYGYDPETDEIYVHLSSFDGSEKTRRLGASDRVSLVVSAYDRPDRWRSVVVDGTITRLPRDAAHERDVPRTFADADLASVNVFDRPLAEVDFEWYVIEPETISGRKAVGN